jgi:hypothetical protein
MSPADFFLFERLHGHLAVLGLAVLAHPIVSLGRPGLSRGTRLSALIAAALLSLSFASGLWIYPPYRALVKPELVRVALPLALRFESKEHLAAICLALALGGVGVLFAAGRHPTGRRAARVLFLLSFLVGLLTGALGVFVAAGGQAL